MGAAPGADRITAALEQVAGWIAAAPAVTVLTGAGMSTESGIPDFRGPDGVWTKDPSARRQYDLEAYRTDPVVRERAWGRRTEHPAWTARPHRGHAALVALERAGRLRAVVTQNIDGLHQLAGNDPRLVLELHGSIHRVECLGCGGTAPTHTVLARVRAGEADPPCEGCGGILKTATVSFGQSLDRAVLAAAVSAAAAADLLLAVGTTLTVRPAASLVDVALGAGARLVVVNDGPTAYDGRAAARVGGRIGQVLPLLVGEPAAA
jgi:NAD-dependent deacetylase